MENLNPTTTNIMANPCPTIAAIVVACRYGSTRASIARRSRPPSIGKAGIQLNAKRVILAWVRHSNSP